jgi:sugar phosphate isomerase/epimerase
MKIAGHTLGTPGMPVEAALRLFHTAGLEAAEIIWQNDYLAAIPEDDSGQIVKNVREISSDLGLDIAGLTPYMSGYNSLDDQERAKDMERLRRCLNVAAELNCHNVRVYAGSYKPGDGQRQEKWQRLVEALQRLGEEAETLGVTLCVENHFNTMTVSAAETVELMQAVNSKGVGILYDQANLAFTHNEPYQEAIDLQREWIRYVHVKDLVFVDASKPFNADEVARVKAEDRSVRSRVVGEGVLDWLSILKKLTDSGYDGYLSLEYEYRWHPDDLPPPEEGFKRSAETLKRFIKDLNNS